MLCRAAATIAWINKQLDASFDLDDIPSLPLAVQLSAAQYEKILLEGAQLDAIALPAAIAQPNGTAAQPTVSHGAANKTAVTAAVGTTAVIGGGGGGGGGGSFDPKLGFLPDVEGAIIMTVHQIFSRRGLRKGQSRFHPHPRPKKSIHLPFVSKEKPLISPYRAQNKSARFPLCVSKR